MRAKSVLMVVVSIMALIGTTRAATVTFSGAADKTIALSSGSLAKWSISNTTGTNNGLPTGTCLSSAPGISVLDAELDPNGTHKLDAFDGAFAIWVDDVRFVSPDSVDLSDDTLTAGPVTLSGLEVTVEYRAFQTSPTLRTLIAFHNPSSAFVGADILLATNFGSDGATGVRGAGSTGGWRVTSDSATSPSDPAVLLVALGPALGLQQSSIPIERSSDTTFFCPSASHQEGHELRGRVTVPPGATAYLLQFAGLSATNEGAVDAGFAFSSNPPVGSELMTGITREQSLAIVNWNFFGEFDLTGGGATWAIDGTDGTSNGQAVGGECTFMPAIGVIDAKSPNHRDAFDSGLVLFVDDQQMPTTATVAKTDQTVTVGPTTLSSLEVRLQYTALQNGPTLRTLVTLHNPTAAAVNTKVQMATNLGSDDKTVVRGTSSGGLSIAPSDTWAITSDDFTKIIPDTVSTHFFAGATAPRITPTVTDRVFDCSESAAPNGVLATFALTLGPGETQALLFYNQVHDTLNDATAAIANFVFLNDSTADEPLFVGLDAATEAQVVNWTICGDTDYPDVLCRLEGLSADARGSGTAGAVLDKLLLRVTVAKTAIGKAGQSTKPARVRKNDKAAFAALKSFEQMLKSKKVQAIFAGGARTRLTDTSAALRATIKKLPARVMLPGVAH